MHSALGSRLVLVLAGLLLAGSAVGQASPAGDSPESPTLQRPKVALVLSGGGARGFAHVGVLRALKDLRVPIDMVVGTSMGAVVGGAYASGRSVDELEAFDLGDLHGSSFRGCPHRVSWHGYPPPGP